MSAVAGGGQCASKNLEVGTALIRCQGRTVQRKGRFCVRYLAPADQVAIPAPPVIEQFAGFVGQLGPDSSPVDESEFELICCDGESSIAPCARRSVVLGIGEPAVVEDEDPMPPVLRLKLDGLGARGSHVRAGDVRFIHAIENGA